MQKARTPIVAAIRSKTKLYRLGNLSLAEVDGGLLCIAFSILHVCCSTRLLCKRLPTSVSRTALRPKQGIFLTTVAMMGSWGSCSKKVVRRDYIIPYSALHYFLVVQSTYKFLS